MTLQSSGAISAGDINEELGRSRSAAFSLGGTSERALAGVASGGISFSDFYGKSAIAIGTFIGSPSSGTTSYAGVSFGTAASDRLIVVTVNWGTGSFTDITLSSATIGGVAATIHATHGHSGGVTGLGAAVISAAVPTGTSGTVALTFSDSIEASNIGVYRLIGLSSNTPHDTLVSTASPGGSTSGTIDIPEGGTLIAAGTGSSNAASSALTFSGVMEAYDKEGTLHRAGGAISTGMSAQTGRTVGVTLGASVDVGTELAAASWA